MIEILIALIILGALLYVVGLLPINQTVKQIIYAVAIVFAAIWLLREFAPLLSLN